MLGLPISKVRCSLPNENEPCKRARPAPPNPFAWEPEYVVNKAYAVKREAAGEIAALPRLHCLLPFPECAQLPPPTLRTTQIVTHLILGRPERPRGRTCTSWRCSQTPCWQPPPPPRKAAPRQRDSRRLAAAVRCHPIPVACAGPQMEAGLGYCVPARHLRARGLHAWLLFAAWGAANASICLLLRRASCVANLCESLETSLQQRWHTLGLWL